VLVSADTLELHAWSGIGLIAAGVYHQGVQLSLTYAAEGEWRAAFTGDAMFAPAGYRIATAPWRAVQWAAWEALRRAGAY
jgi:hypothetical protein